MANTGTTRRPSTGCLPEAGFTRRRGRRAKPKWQAHGVAAVGTAERRLRPTSYGQLKGREERHARRKRGTASYVALLITGQPSVPSGTAKKLQPTSPVRGQGGRVPIEVATASAARTVEPKGTTRVTAGSQGKRRSATYVAATSTCRLDARRRATRRKMAKGVATADAQGQRQPRRPPVVSHRRSSCRGTSSSRLSNMRTTIATPRQ